MVIVTENTFSQWSEFMWCKEPTGKIFWIGADPWAYQVGYTLGVGMDLWLEALQCNGSLFLSYTGSWVLLDVVVAGMLWHPPTCPPCLCDTGWVVVILRCQERRKKHGGQTPPLAFHCSELSDVATQLLGSHPCSQISYNRRMEERVWKDSWSSQPHLLNLFFFFSKGRNESAQGETWKLLSYSLS